MTEREFARTMAAMEAVVGNQMTKQQSAAWYEMLKDLTVPQLEQGVKLTLLSYTYAGFPPVGKIREAAGVRSGAFKVEDRATLAWEAVRRAIARVGAYESPKFVDDPYIVPTIRAMGGWVQLCDTPPDEMQWREKAFRTNYATLSQHPVSPEMAGQLGTLCDLGGIPNIALVRSLPAGTEVVHRIAEPPEGKRISASEAAEKLVKRLGVDDVTAEPQKWANVSKVEQLAALSALAGRKS